ncbi:hypothetical protein FRB95_007050, partial [Tulasnella sp. JGI-2019a]
HIAEETKNASNVAGHSILRTAIGTCTGAFIALIMFLFCSPTIETLFSLNTPQPFVLIYSMALGRGGAVTMTLIAVLGAIASLVIVMLAASRIIFAIARDGALPFSSWVARVTPSGRPQNAVTVVYIFSATLLCMILPSAAAFTSLVSGATVPFIASYGLVALLRLFVTPNEFRNSKFPLGKARKPLYAISVLFNGMAFMAGVIFGAITIFGVLSFWLTPVDRWLPREKIQEMCDGANDISGAEEVPEIPQGSSRIYDTEEKGKE